MKIIKLEENKSLKFSSPREWRHAINRKYQSYRTLKMINQRYCKPCKERYKKKNKLKHKNSQKHKEIESLIIYRYFVGKPDFFKVRAKKKRTLK